MTRVLAPVAGSALFAALGPWSPNVLSAMLLGVIAVIGWLRLIREDCLAKDRPMCRDAESPA